MRGKVQVDAFGPITLPEYVEHIRGQSVVAGFGIAGNALALRGIRDQLAKRGA